MAEYGWLDKRMLTFPKVCLSQNVILERQKEVVFELGFKRDDDLKGGVKRIN